MQTIAESVQSKLKVVLLFSGIYAFYYLCRYNYPIALPFIQNELGVSAAQVGAIATALTAGYAVGQLVNGVLVDRAGPRLMMTVGGIGAMVANLLMGGSPVLIVFVLAWLVNGYFQAMGYPSTLKLVANWFRKEERGRAVGASEFAQSIASIAIPAFAAFLADRFHWRLVFAVPAAMLGLATVWYYSQAQDYPPGIVAPRKSTPLLRDMLQRYQVAFGNWQLVGANLSYGFSQFVRYAMITWIPAYLYLETGMDLFGAAIGGTAFQMGGALGSVLVGVLSDTKLFRERRWLLIALGMAFSSLAGIGVGLIPSEQGWDIIILLTLCGMGIEALEVAYFLTPVDCLGQDMAATGVGCMNATGKAVASLQGVMLGRIIDVFGYGAAFGTAGGFGLLAAVLVLPLGLARRTSCR